MKIKFFIGLLIMVSLLTAQETSQTFLSLKQTGVEQFLKDHPEYDGRGTIVLIFDTGVDMGIPGLTKTSTGETKVIDVQDFTGQGDLKVYEADIDEDDDIYYFVNEDMEYKVKGADKFENMADDFYIGVFDEQLLKNSGSGAADQNGNGKEDDKYYFVAFNTKAENGDSYSVVYFDKNGNGDLADEEPIRSYHENLDAFYIENGNGIEQLWIGLNIHLDKKIVSFHFDDGAHGTHCAGIATGYKIGNTDLNGVAPGAKLVSCKLGNNNYSGGATVTESMKKCFDYADSLSKARKEPVIINMSFGIGSEIEGHSDMAKYIEGLLEKNPYFYVCTSNGNEGPGISTSGLPAASTMVLSSGAVLTKEVGYDNYGANLDKDIILYFSSRGGETGKPDVISPGACTSTVPNWEGSDKFWGTSMASPYSAGVVSLLMSAMIVEYPDTKIPSGLVFKAVRESATKWTDYETIDQGGGFINIEAAYAKLKKYINDGELKKYETYTVETFAPNMPGRKAPNIYIRNGKFLDSSDIFTVTVTRNNFINKSKFYRTFNLTSDKDWLIPVAKRTYMRNDQEAKFNVKFDLSKMTEPGLYNGTIKATRADKSKFEEFEVMATVVIPYEFTSDNQYSMKACGKLAPGKYGRYFVNIPAGASSMKITLSSVEGKHADMNVKIHKPNGREIRGSSYVSSKGKLVTVDKFLFNPEAGIYELDVDAYYKAQDTSYYKLNVEFNGVQRLDNMPLSEDHSSLTLFNNFNNKKVYMMGASIEGYCSHFAKTISGGETYEYEFYFAEGEASKTFKVMVSKEDFNKFTDFSVMVKDADGKTLDSDALSYNSTELTINNNFDADTKLKLVLVPGFALKSSSLVAHVKAETKIKSPVRINASFGYSPVVVMYPSVETKVNLQFSKPEMELPEGAKFYGELELTDYTSKETEVKIPLYFKF